MSRADGDEVDDQRSFFDTMAARVDTVVARAPFFTACATFVVLWLVGLPWAGWQNDIYHLLLNSPTTAITFLLVAVGANTAARWQKSVDLKLNAMARAQADLMEALADTLEGERCADLRADAEELRASAGAEDEVGA